WMCRSDRRACTISAAKSNCWRDWMGSYDGRSPAFRIRRASTRRGGSGSTVQATVEPPETLAILSPCVRDRPPARAGDLDHSAAFAAAVDHELARANRLSSENARTGASLHRSRFERNSPMKRMTILLFIAATAAFAQQPAPDDPIGQQLFPPDLIMAQSQKLRLDDKQRATVKNEVQRAQ